MKSNWIGMGFSHHSVPSLSNTATRSSTGTDSHAATKSRIACLAGPARHFVSSPVISVSFPGHHGDGLALEVDVWVAAHVYGDAVDRAAGELVRRVARVIVGHGLAAVTPDGQALAGDRELAGLGLDTGFTDLLVAVVERQHPGRDAGRVLAVLLECGGEDQPLAGRQLLVGHDVLLHDADEVVDVVQPVVLDVERVPPEPRAVGEQHALCVAVPDVDHGPDGVGAVAQVDRL